MSESERAVAPTVAPRQSKFHEGYAGFLSEKANPYQEGTDDFKEWAFGFAEALAERAW